MTILNEASDGTLSVLLALRDTLRAYGPVPKKRLLALCAPGTVTDGKKAKDTLRRWTQLGALEERDDLVHLSADIAPEACDDPRTLRRALTKIVLRPENRPVVGEGERSDEGDDKESAGGSLAGDFALATAWCLLQDPFTSSSTWETVESHLLSQEVRAVQNSTRWHGFVRWSTFLGFSVALPSRGSRGAPPILVNPAVAAWDVIDGLLPPGATLELATLLTGLWGILPVLPGGEVSQKVAARIAQPWQPFAAHEVAPAVSLALLQWRAVGKIRLMHQSDANVRKLLGRGRNELATYSHVERLG